MGEILRGYDLNDATWFYLSLLLTVAVFFRFNRVWSLRNLDLTLLLCLSPGLLLVKRHQDVGYLWLFTVTGLLLLRLCCDGLLTRRPRLEQNLNISGLGFLCASAFAFQMVTVITEPPPQQSIDTVRRGEQLLNREDSSSLKEQPPAGPASTVVAAAVGASSKAVATGTGTLDGHSAVRFDWTAARIMAILAHTAVLAGLMLIGQRLFGDLQTGVAMATLYLLLPCTVYDVAEVVHVLPAALILWAVLAYRRPMVAGSLMGLACGTLFFPIFLLPLWWVFYGKRNALRFGLALALVAVALAGSLVFTSADAHSFAEQTTRSIDISSLKFRGGGTEGFWSTHDQTYRIPVFVAFLVMLAILVIWPRKKNVEHLIAHSTAIIVATQFWYPQYGGVYLLWYLPLLLLVVFRPRLANLVPPNGTTDESAKRMAEPQGTALAGAPNRLMR